MTAPCRSKGQKECQVFEGNRYVSKHQTTNPAGLTDSIERGKYHVQSYLLGINKEFMEWKNGMNFGENLISTGIKTS